ncbi:MAG: alpha/beta fold hydrolase [Actinomycetota bacterium]
MNPVGVARAIRGLVGERAIADRSLLARVDAPAIVIAREGDPIHPAALGRAIAETLPNAELIELASEEDLLASIPMLVDRVARFLA